MMRLPLPRIVPVLLAGLVFTLTPLSRGESPPSCLTPRCVNDLKNLSVCELWALFAQGKVEAIPTCDLDGRVLYLDGCLGRAKVFRSNLVWRGKHSSGDHFTNRWVGNIRWLGADVAVGPSWVDGRPAIIMDYAPGTPLFGNMHDELREIAPGLFLGLIYRRDPCPRFHGFFAIETCRTCQ